ncbi:MAG: hypothetical protein KF773_17915 [Deltaproteobacteria bacterium]|nr:hypothetical protein [Deltaproteobacteria bacterium]
MSEDATPLEKAPTPSGSLPVRARLATPLPMAAVYEPELMWPHVVHVAVWIALAIPALYQLGLLITAIGGRVSYPYDLEWMEGGMLHHAQRIRDGAGLYVPPSVDFIPYLYTPLYPSLLALVGKTFGISYTLGRMFSVLSLIGIAIVAIVTITSRRCDHPRAAPAWVGGLLGLGLFAAYYPVVDGWYDLVRADTLFLFMITGGIAALPSWARSEGPWGHAKTAAGAALLALAFFTKQTGIVYVVFGGGIVLVVAWRRAPTYVATAGVIGLGMTWLLERTTNGWFWTYASKIHRAHDFNMDRFWESFGNILLGFPGKYGKLPVIGIAITVAIVVGLGATAAAWWKRRSLPPQARPLLVWTAAYAVSIVVGAIGYGTEFAHFNAYMPAFLHGSLAAGAAVPAVYACARVLYGERPRRELVTSGAAVAVALPLAITCLTASWSPGRYIPTEADVEAGEKLIAHLRSIDGEIWMPSHPWYLRLAGKTPRVHRMGVTDVTHRQPQNVVEGLAAALDRKVFAALVLDSRDVHSEATATAALVKSRYRPMMTLPTDERPRVYSGAGTRQSWGGVSTPDSIWIPIEPPRAPDGARTLFDFEAPQWTSWDKTGTAWGPGPVATALPGQGLVFGATGARFATSMHGGDAAVGRLTSPVFMIDADKLTMRLGGGTDAKLRVELWVDDQIAATTNVPRPGGSMLREVILDVVKLRGKTAKLVFVDDSPTGHLIVDDVWAW